MPSSDPASDPAYEHPISSRPATSEPVLPAEGPQPEPPLKHDPYAAWRTPGYKRYLLGNFASVIGRQMTSVAVGWEIYRRTGSATLLGLVGLAAAIPLFLCTIPAGHLADRRPRKQIILATQAIAIFTSLGLAALSAWHTRLPDWLVLELPRQGLEWVVSVFDHNPAPRVDRGIVGMLALIFVAGLTRTFGWAARTAFVPLLVPKSVLPNAITWNSSVFQTAGAAGPAVGGLLIAGAGFPVVYCVDALCAAGFFLLMLPVRVRQEIAERQGGGSRLEELLSGIRFVFRHKLVLATITLDLFAVLLGGAVALLPMFADRLGVGPMGLGWLRAADSLGAITMGIVIAHLPPMKHAGRTLLAAIVAYGVAIIGFGLSPWFWLSLLTLFLTGVFDSLNVVIRHTLVQVVTPDSLRGRVGAVNNIFVGSSTELGAFRSGITAGLLGPVTAVVMGGAGTILAVVAIAWKWPEIRRFRSFDSARPLP